MNSLLINQFCSIVGKENALTEQDLIAPYLVEPRGLYHGQTPLVLRPQTTTQVAEIMALATKNRIAIVPQGGNTGLVGAQQPNLEFPAIILSLAKLNQIRAIDPIGNTVLVEAGVILEDLARVVDAQERYFPLSLGSEGSCQIGGNLSSNAGGTAVLAYGNARELCLGLEVVLPDGRILNDLRRVKKDNSGYDLKNLFIGAEGTLGVITAAMLKIYPKPRGRAVAFVGLTSPKYALSFLNLAQQFFGPRLTAFELISEISLELSLNFCKTIQPPFIHKYPWFVLLETQSHHDSSVAQNDLTDLLETALAQELIEDATVAANATQENKFWRLRESISPAQKQLGGSIKHDISVPIAAIPDFIEKANAVVEASVAGARVVCFGHMGDGNLHYNVSQPETMSKAEFLTHWVKLNHEIHSLAMLFKGSFSAEHGIGQLKRDELIAFKSPVALELMAGIKKLFDPLNIMNPGKILKIQQ